MSIDVRPLDPWDDDEFEAAYEVLVAGETSQRPHAVAEDRDGLRATLVHPSPTMPVQGWMACLDGHPAGLLMIAWPLVDDLQACWPRLTVAPEKRRRGVGTALYEVLIRAVRMAGRSIIQVEVPHVDGVDAWPGRAFAERHGFELALREVHSVLTLPVAPERLSVEPTGGYVVHTWRDRCPEDLVDAYCRLREIFAREAPTGTLVIEEQHWSAERLRDLEQRRYEQGRSAWTTVGVAPDATVVGFTELTAARTARDAVQNQTLVLPDHRGHRLGIAMKGANLRRLAEDQPSLERVHTWVSPDNTAMNDVNVEFGFEPVEMLDVWQVELRGGERPAAAGHGDQSRSDTATE